MILKQYYLGCLSHASYLVGRRGQPDRRRRGPAAGRGTVPGRRPRTRAGHPPRLPDPLPRRLRRRPPGASRPGRGHDLPRRPGERRSTGTRPLKEGDRVEFGKVRLQALEAPGHTPEGISLLVFDLATDADRPHAVLTGDTLFIGDVGRPDLMASVGMAAADLAGMLYDSLHGKLLSLPDETLVYPAHGAGSMCGKHLSKETVSTIGQQRRFNYALQPMGRDEFIRMVTADQPERPPTSPTTPCSTAASGPRWSGTWSRRCGRWAWRTCCTGPRSGRPGPRRPRRRRLRGGPPGRQPEHRPGRPVRFLGRHAARPGSAHRAGRRARPGAGGGHAPGPHRLRPRRRLPGGRPRRLENPARAGPPDRAHHRRRAARRVGPAAIAAGRGRAAPTRNGRITTSRAA